MKRGLEFLKEFTQAKMLYRTKFTIRVYDSYTVAYICQDIVNYYYSLIPKYYYAQRQKYPAHITVVRKGIELANLEKYDGYRGFLEYDPIINHGGAYFWLNSYSTDIGKIRESVGLPQYRGDFTSYHITIGNTK